MYDNLDPIPEFLKNVSTPKLETIPNRSEPGAKKKTGVMYNCNCNLSPMMIAIFLFSEHFFSMIYVHHKSCTLRSFAFDDYKTYVSCFAFIVLRKSCYCKCSETLSHGAVGWSVVCDCGIS